MARCKSIDAVRDRVSKVPGLMVFLTVAGRLIHEGESLPVFRELRRIPLLPDQAWNIIDRWEQLYRHESETGWTVELAVARYVMECSPATWRTADWRDMQIRLELIRLRRL